MLPTQPQSVMGVFFSSIKLYKKIFISLLPISVIWIAIHAVNRILEKIDQPWAILCAVLTALLGVFCFCYGICFVYDLLTKQTAGYKDALITNLRKILRILAFYSILLVVIFALVFVITYFFGETLNNFLPKKDSAFKILAITFLLFTSISLCFFMVFTLEIILKNSGFLSAIKKSLKITFNIKNMARMLYFLTIALLFSLLLFAPIFILVLLLNFFPSATIWIVILLFIWLIPTLIISVSLYLIIPIYLYNDLILRYESRYTN